MITEENTSCQYYLEDFIDIDSEKNVILIARKHFKDNYIDNLDYKDWKFEVSKDASFTIKNGPLIKLLQDKKMEEMQKRFEENRKIVDHGLTKYFDRLKEQGYQGIVNYEGYTLADWDRFASNRDDIKIVNQGQYKIVYNDEDTSKKENKPFKKISYNIPYNNPFFMDKKFFSKNDKLIRSFLVESEKVAIAPEMLLVPFFCKRTYYYLTIDNLTEQISLDSVNNAFKHINRQSNFYYQISPAISKELRDDYEEFEHHFLKKMRKATGINNKLLKENYKNLDRLLNSKYFYNTNLSK